jgi:hypothetical protein
VQVAEHGSSKLVEPHGELQKATIQACVRSTTHSGTNGETLPRPGGFVHDWTTRELTHASLAITSPLTTTASASCATT